MVRWLLAALLLLLFALPARAQDLLVEAELSAGSALVQAEVIYTARLLRRSSLTHGYLMMPEIPDAAVEPLGEREELVQRPDGAWRLIEQRFALFPQRSGTLVIPAPVFSGRERFQRGPELTLTVQPKPAAAPGWWLPARGLTLRQEALPADIAVGAPLHRTIVLEADGLTGAQLPALPPPNLSGLRAIRLGETAETQVIDGAVRGRRTERHLLVPEKPGAYTLSELSVTWWDTTAGAARLAVLPAHVVTVTGAALAPRPNMAAPAIVAAPAPAPGSNWWPWVLPVTTALLGGLVAARLARSPVWGQRRRWRALRRACHAGEARQARAALLAWADAPNLRHIAARLPETKPLLADLDAAAYGQRAWDGRDWLRRAAPLLRQRQSAPPPEPVLPPLYQRRRST